METLTKAQQKVASLQPKWAQPCPTCNTILYTVTTQGCRICNGDAGFTSHEALAIATQSAEKEFLDACTARARARVNPDLDLLQRNLKECANLNSTPYDHDGCDGRTSAAVIHGIHNVGVKNNKGGKPIRQQVDGSLRCVFISDTHCRHRLLDIPHGDVLVHTGDISMAGEVETMLDFCEWLDQMPHQHKIVIPGNHDLTLSNSPKWLSHNAWRFMHQNEQQDIQNNRAIVQAAFEKACILMKGDGRTHRIPFPSCGTRADGVGVCNANVDINNLKCPHDASEGNDGGGVHVDHGTELNAPQLSIAAMPYMPMYKDWAFMLQPPLLKQALELLPTEPYSVDILLTHAPPAHKRDAGTYTNDKSNTPINDVIRGLKPRLVAFGHVHQGYGVLKEAETTYINASSVNTKMKPLHRPIVVDFLPPASK